MIDKTRLMRSPDAENITVHPSRAGQVILAAIGVPFVLLGVAGAWDNFVTGEVGWAIATGLLLPAGGLWLMTEISTVRLHLSRDRLWLMRRGSVRWSVERSNAVLKAGGVGDLAVLPGLVVFDRQSGRKVGEIISGQFLPDELAQLTAEIGGEPPSATRVHRPRKERGS